MLFDIFRSQSAIWADLLRSVWMCLSKKSPVMKKRVLKLRLMLT